MEVFWRNWQGEFVPVQKRESGWEDRVSLRVVTPDLLGSIGDPNYVSFGAFILEMELQRDIPDHGDECVASRAVCRFLQLQRY